MARLDGQDPHELLTAADAAPTDLAAALAGADAALALGDVNAALGRALEAVRTHAGEEREEARLRLLELFEVIGSTSPEVAQALQAQAVPTVVALISGQPVPMFQGPVAEDQLRAVIDQLLEVAAANGVSGTIAVDAAASTDAQAEPEETEVERAAREAIEAGDFAAAEEVYTHAIAQNPGDDDLKVARNQVRLMARMDGQDPHQLLAAADAAPADLDAALAGADAALALGDVNAALGRALEAVRAHQGEERESARLRLLELFEIIGATSPEVAQARRRLASLLY